MLGTPVRVLIDRPLGSLHPVYHFAYELNYGYVPEFLGGDNQAQDAYVIGPSEAVASFNGIVIAIVVRRDDNECKWVVAEQSLPLQSIRAQVHFQEQYFESIIYDQRGIMRIAIDGPAGSGKSTVSKQLARELGYDYIDTGAMYRALTFFFLEQGVVAEQDTAPYLKDMDMDIIPGGISLNGRHLTHELRTEQIDEHVSYYSSLKSLRDWCVNMQQNLGRRRNVVMDGRDIGTVVFPDAELKFFLVADPQERARRRALERGEMDHYDEILLDLIRRDRLDSSRTHSPLRQAEDAIAIDTTDLSIDQVVARMKDYWYESTASPDL